MATKNKKQRCVVRYKIGDYPIDEEVVFCDPSTEYDQVIQLSKDQITERIGGLVNGTPRFWVVERKEFNGRAEA